MENGSRKTDHGELITDEGSRLRDCGLQVSKRGCARKSFVEDPGEVLSDQGFTHELVGESLRFQSR
jgi:hypothetical protein